MDNRAYSIPVYIQQLVSDWKRHCRQNYRDHCGLSHTEGIVLRLVSCGLLYKQIADVMGRSWRTTKKQVQTLHQKTGAKNIADLTRYAIKHGYINVDD